MKRDDQQMAKLKVEPVKHPDRIINYWKKEAFVVTCIVLFGLSFNGLSVLSPIYQGKLIDSLVSGRDLYSTIIMAGYFVAFIGLIQILRYFKRFYIRRFANNTSATMRLMIYNTILHKTTIELQHETIGNIMTRAISDVDLCVEGMRKFSTEIFDTGVYMIAFYISLLFYDVETTIVSTLFIPVAMLFAEKLKTVVYKYSTAYRTKSSEIAESTYDSIENAMLYRVSGMEQQNAKRYEKDLEDLQNKAIKANILENSMQPIYNVIAMLGVIPLIYIGGSKVLDGSWTVGVFSTYMILFVSIAIKASKASKLFNSVQKSQVSWKRIKPYLSEYKNKGTSCDINLENTRLSVTDLSFNYAENNKNVIENINFTGTQGEMIGITGTIASGKTTLGLSLLGLYPYIGSIRIDEKELNEYSDYERSQMISYLAHKPELLSDTIYNNITLGRIQNIEDVIHDVCFEEELGNMPEGQETPVGNSGVRLSGGQQSRIGLARTLLGKNKIIILDDPFAAVDSKTEEEILANLRANYKKSLIILISHRLTAFPKMDKILLLHSDKTTSYGTHYELMSTDPLYETIFNLQCNEIVNDSKNGDGKQCDENGK